MYYWTLLNKGKEELVKRVFLAMNEFNEKTDWLTQVKDDLTACSIDLTQEEISKMSHFSFKNLVDKKLKEKCFDYLAELQAKHSKSMFLHQSDKMQEYLTTDQLTIKEKQLLFKLRSGVTPNKANFKKKYENNLSCILCLDPDSVETLEHLLECSYLATQPQLEKEIKSIKCEDIYSELSKQVKAVKIWNKIFKIYAKHTEI